MSNAVPENQWKNKLHAHLTYKTKFKVLKLIRNQDTTYEELKEALLGCSAMTFSSAAEEFFKGKKGKLAKLDPRQAAQKMLRLVGKLTQEAEDVQVVCEYITVVALRSWMVPELKTYVDMSKLAELQPFLRITEEWERSQPEGTPLFRKKNTTKSDTHVQTGTDALHGFKKINDMFSLRQTETHVQRVSHQVGSRESGHTRCTTDTTCTNNELSDKDRQKTSSVL